MGEKCMPCSLCGYHAYVYCWHSAYSPAGPDPLWWDWVVDPADPDLYWHRVCIPTCRANAQ